MKNWKIYKNLGKARRLKQAKDEATEEIDKYRADRDKQFKEFESKVKLKKCFQSEELRRNVLSICGKLFLLIHFSIWDHVKVLPQKSMLIPMLNCKR